MVAVGRRRSGLRGVTSAVDDVKIHSIRVQNVQIATMLGYGHCVSNVGPRKGLGQLRIIFVNAFVLDRLCYVHSRCHVNICTEG